MAHLPRNCTLWRKTNQERKQVPCATAFALGIDKHFIKAKSQQRIKDTKSNDNFFSIFLTFRLKLIVWQKNQLVQTVMFSLFSSYSLMIFLLRLATFQTEQDYLRLKNFISSYHDDNYYDTFITGMELTENNRVISYLTNESIGNFWFQFTFLYGTWRAWLCRNSCNAIECLL